MIIENIVTINENEFIERYSDKFYITRDGILFESAFDPIEFRGSRTYTETDIELPEETER